MESRPERTYSIGELAERAGVSRRTVRFYVGRRLIDPPRGRGRGSAYGERHVEQIRRVRALQREGLDLEAIRRLPEAARPAPRAAPEPRVVVRIPLARGLSLELDAERRLPDRGTLERLAQACARVLGHEAQAPGAPAPPNGPPQPGDPPSPVPEHRPEGDPS